MTAFDIERAKAGEDIQFSETGTNDWVDASFIGCKRNGYVLVELIGGENVGSTQFVPPSYIGWMLRMAPKPPREMWVQVYISKYGEIELTPMCETPGKTIMWTDGGTLFYEPQKILVPEE